jgi:hypothetical protein
MDRAFYENPVDFGASQPMEMAQESNSRERSNALAR